MTQEIQINEPLFRKVVEFLEANPKKWFQNNWIRDLGDNGEVSCGTTGCIAGWTVLLSPEVDFSKINETNLVVMPNGKAMPIKWAAQDLLGLTDDQAWAIFQYVRDGDDEPVTWSQMKARITRVTGIQF